LTRTLGCAFKRQERIVPPTNPVTPVRKTQRDMGVVLGSGSKLIIANECSS
jgi:hypothetical protein